MTCTTCNTALYALEKVLKLLESRYSCSNLVEECWTLQTAISEIKGKEITNDSAPKDPI